MALRFRKTKSLMGGLVRVNIGKTGPTLGLGPRGTSLGIGKQGVHANVGIPGTGMSVRQKLNGKTAAEATAEATSGVRNDFASAGKVFWITVGTIMGLLSLVSKMMK